MHFIPTVYTEHGASPPRTGPSAKADFLRQHIDQGWTRSDALARYELWVSRAIDTNPALDRSSHEKLASAAIESARKRTGD